MTDVYASSEDLEQALGIDNTDGIEDRLALALVVGTQWVRGRVGLAVSDTDLTPPYSLTVIAAPAVYRAATIAAANRFYQSAQAPFGVMGFGDTASYVRSAIPEAELILFGYRQSFGIA